MEDASEMNIDYLVANLTPPEKYSLLAGADFWHTVAIPRLKIPAIRMSDGPNGVRGTSYFHGTRAACFPCGTGLGATWNADLMEEAGVLMGQESVAKGAAVLLGPTVNMHRAPLGGRGFESFSEDPVLSGNMAAAVVRGIQGTGVAACIKHLVCNDQEDERCASDSVVSDRALREIYLMPFQIAQRDSRPRAYMTSYNKVNGTHASESRWLVEGVLRKEWGFDGAVISDWFGTYSAAEAVNAGLDLEMPGPSIWRGPLLMHSVFSRKVTMQTVDSRVRNVLNLVKHAARLGVPERAEEREVNTPQTAATLRRVAADGIVLCKNDGNVLPLRPDLKTAVIGPNAKIAAYSGGGSAKLSPYYAVTPLDGLRVRCESLSYAAGSIGYRELPLLSLMACTPDGRASGVEARIYTEPPSVPDRRPVETIILDDTYCLLDGWAHPAIEGTLFWMEVECTVTPDASLNHLFSLTVNGTATLYVDGEMVVDNSEAQRKGDSFFGQGTMQEVGEKMLEKGRVYRVLVRYGTAPTSKMNATNPHNGAGGLRIGFTPDVKPELLLEEAVELAKSVDQVVLCIGTSHEWEFEGQDRPNLLLPPGTDELVTAVCKVNRNVVVVNQSGTPVSMPWAESAPAILQAFFGGNETGNAIADVVFGATNPSGKMPLTWPLKVEDNPAFFNYKSDSGKVHYGEGVYIGYRFYEKTAKPVLFPFGHGLSYTSFTLSDLRLADMGPDRLAATVSLENIGAVAGSEVVQLYVTRVRSSIQRPPKELKGFKKVFLAPGERAVVEIQVSKKYATSHWDEHDDSFVMEKGEYQVKVGTSSIDGAHLVATFDVPDTTYWRGL